MKFVGVHSENHNIFRVCVCVCMRVCLLVHTSSITDPEKIQAKHILLRHTHTHSRISRHIGMNRTCQVSRNC